MRELVNECELVSERTNKIRIFAYAAIDTKLIAKLLVQVVYGIMRKTNSMKTRHLPNPVLDLAGS